MQKKNIVFLDINGVVETVYSKSHLQFDPYCMQELKRVANQPDTAIVITSNWRIGRTLEDLQGLFSPYGIHNVIGSTPAIPYSTREEEIKEWIENAPYTNGVIVNQYIILDDDNDYTQLQNHLIQTSYQTGITHSIGNEIINRWS